MNEFYFTKYLYVQEMLLLAIMGILSIPISFVFLKKYNLIWKKEFIGTIASYTLILGYFSGWLYKNQKIQYSDKIAYMFFVSSAILLIVSLFYILKGNTSS